MVLNGEEGVKLAADKVYAIGRFPEVLRRKLYVCQSLAWSSYMLVKYDSALSKAAQSLASVTPLHANEGANTPDLSSTTVILLLILQRLTCESVATAQKCCPLSNILTG